MTRPVTLVSCGVLVDEERGRYLLGSRPQGKPYAGYWELPGGKLERGETPLECLEREFLEELGVRIGCCMPWLALENDYPHAYVRLHIYRIFAHEGTLQAREGQMFRWFDFGDIPRGVQLLPKVAQMVRSLHMPQIVRDWRFDSAGRPVIDGVAGTAVPHPENARWEIPEGSQFALLDAGREVAWRSPVPVYFPACDESELTSARELGAHGIVIDG